jgi:hypothetical protein
MKQRIPPPLGPLAELVLNSVVFTARLSNRVGFFLVRVE